MVSNRLPRVCGIIGFKNHVSWSAVRNNHSRQKLIVLGTGWSSYSVLKTVDRKKYSIKVVSPRNHFLFTPLLCSTTVGTLEFRSITEPIRNIGFDAAEDFSLSSAESLDIPNKVLTCRSVLDEKLIFNFAYDKLIIGVGARNNTFGIPGADKYACFLKEIHHAQQIRRKIIMNCEIAMIPHLPNGEKERLLHTVIVGGGPTGVEFGAELYDFKVKDVRRLYKHEEGMFRVTLIESAQILGTFSPKLQSYAEKKIKERVNFQLIKSTVTEVKEDCVVLRDGTVIPCGLVVWSAGLSPQHFVDSLTVPKNDRGQILTDSYLKILGDPKGAIYAIGDCASIEDKPLPCTAQVAERQGRYLAKTLNRLPEVQAEEFHFTSLGMLAYIGDYEGITDLPDFKIHGVTSWFLWRSAYLTRLGSWRLRMQVPIDWLKTILFGRDTSRFN